MLDILDLLMKLSRAHLHCQKELAFLSVFTLLPATLRNTLLQLVKLQTILFFVWLDTIRIPTGYTNAIDE